MGNRPEGRFFSRPLGLSLSLYFYVCSERVFGEAFHAERTNSHSTKPVLDSFISSVAPPACPSSSLYAKPLVDERAKMSAGYRGMAARGDGEDTDEGRLEKGKTHE